MNYKDKVITTKVVCELKHCNFNSISLPQSYNTLVLKYNSMFIIDMYMTYVYCFLTIK